MEKLKLGNLLIEHQKSPLGIDCESPRFCWELLSKEKNVVQTAYQIIIRDEQEKIVCDTGKINDDKSIEVEITELKLIPVMQYQVLVKAWDNSGNAAEIEGRFETGKLGGSWVARWIEPDQIPTVDSMEGKEINRKTLSENPFKGIERDFAEFQPVQYIRIPFTAKKLIKKARVYVTAHGTYKLEINGEKADDRELAPEITSYDKLLQYQTYDITSMLSVGDNVLGIELADGWWSGRVGMTGDSCQFGNKTALLLEAKIIYEDGSEEIVTGEQGKSMTGPILFSDIFVGEKYDARKEMEDWSKPEFDDSTWRTVNVTEYPYSNLIGQYGEPVRPIKVMVPKSIIYTPAGELVVDTGQVLAGQVEFTITAPAGEIIKLEHSEVLDEQGNFFNNIIGVNKEQQDIYITKEGKQTYRPHFTYHGFRYIKITGWIGTPKKTDFKIYVLSSEMEDIGSLVTSSSKLNKLLSNIWWSQVSNTISIPTDCPQRERAGWTGDIMAFAPTLCMNRRADAFLTRWMKNLCADQLENGAVPNVVPYLKSYRLMAQATTGVDTSCGWGDAVLHVPFAVYQQYGDTRILKENYAAMKKWLGYIQDRAENHHPDDYDTWSEARKKHSKYLWNTDFHYGDWLVPSMVLGNTDAMAMINTARATMRYVAPQYYANSAKTMSQIAEIVGNQEDFHYYNELYENIRKAFIDEYLHEDGTMDADLQGIYIIALKNKLYTEDIRPKMIAHLRELIEKNKGCLDTGFLSVLYLLDVLCENECRDLAYSLLYQNKCPSWLYEVEHGATTIWESWGAIGDKGEVSTYSYNHYAFGCVGEWMYRELGGIQVIEPGYKKFRIKPSFDCGLDYVHVKEHTPYGLVEVKWNQEEDNINIQVLVPCNTTAEVNLPGYGTKTVGSGEYSFSVKKQ